MLVVCEEQNVDETYFDLPACDLETVQVPGEKPRTRAQYNCCKDVWPCKFKEDVYLEQQLNDTLFDSQERDLLSADIKDLTENYGKVSNVYIIVL